MYKLKCLGLLLVIFLCASITRVNAGVTASFTVSKADLCRDTAFKFSDGSSVTGGESIISYTWDFGDGSGTSSSTNPTYKYSAPGIYTVSLTVKGDAGGSSTTKSKVTVHLFAKPAFVLSSGVLCDRAELSFDATKNTADSVTSYLWTFSDGGSSTSASTTKLVNGTGNFKVTLTVKNKYGCTDTVSHTYNILPKPKAIISYVSHCQDSLITLSSNTSQLNGTTITRYRWILPGNVIVDSQKVTRRFGGGLLPVRLILTNANGCDDSLSQLFTVFANPNINVVAQTTCADSVIYFYDNSSGAAKWNWDFGFSGFNNTLTYTARRDTLSYAGFPGPGTYQVTLKLESSKGCITTKTFPVTVNPLPIPTFLAQDRCQDTGVQFTDKTTGTISKRLWKFSDSTTSTVANPLKKFRQPGPAWAQLFITNQFGCKDSLLINFVINPKPKAVIYGGDGCQDSLVSFQSSSFVKSNPGRPDSIRNIVWIFGDGTPNDTSTIVTHRYVNPGTYKLKLVAVSGYGCADTLVKSIVINDKAKAGFNYGGLCERDSVEFNSTATVAAGYSIAEIRWNWGDFTNDDTGKRTVHVFQNPGTYNITQQVTTNKGCVTYLTKSLTILPTPRTDYSYTLACFGVDVQFSDKTVYAGSGGTTQGFTWDFGDSTSSILQNPTHKFPRSGTYYVKLTVRSTDGCTGSIVYPVRVYPLPNPSFNVANNCSDSLFYFSSTSTIPEGNIIKYSWNFGDNTTATGGTVSKKFAQPGNYNVTLYATSDQNCVDSITKVVTVFEKPVASTTYTTNCADSAVQFTNTSYILGNDSVTSWLWLFNNGQDIFTTKDVKYNFPSEGGDFSVRMIAYSSHGCADTLDIIVTVNSVPKPNFSAPARCEKNTYNFFDITPPLLVGVVDEWTWDFGDGGGATGKNVQHIYTDSGTYMVKLTVKTEKGCTASVTMPAVVYPIPRVKFWYSGACLGEDFNFVDSTEVPGGIINRTWEFGDASGSRSSQPNPSFNYSDTPGVYRVRLSITANNGGCLGYLDSFIRVFGPPKPKFITSPVCKGNVTKFFDRSAADFTNIIEYRYDFGDGQRATYAPGMPVNHVYEVEGLYPVKLTVVTQEGCAASYDSVVNVYPLPVASFIADPLQLSVNDSLITFTNNSKGAVQTFWDFGDGETVIDNAKQVKHIYGDTGVFIITMAVTNSQGCTDTARYTLDVLEVYSMFAPNSFSPNGDDVNDAWQPLGAGFARYSVIVVDRWGQKVFESTDPNEKWNGKVMNTGADAPVGEYRYVVNATDFYESEFNKLKGFILLIR